MVLPRELGRREVLATFRLAIGESATTPDLARTLDEQGQANTISALTRLLSDACDKGLPRGGDPVGMANLFTSVLTGDGFLVRMLMRVRDAPTDEEARNRATMATTILTRPHGVGMPESSPLPG